MVSKLDRLSRSLKDLLHLLGAVCIACRGRAAGAYIAGADITPGPS